MASLFASLGPRARKLLRYVGFVVLALVTLRVRAPADVPVRPGQGQGDRGAVARSTTSRSATSSAASSRPGCTSRRSRCGPGRPRPATSRPRSTSSSSGSTSACCALMHGTIAVKIDAKIGERPPQGPRRAVQGRHVGPRRGRRPAVGEPAGARGARPADERQGPARGQPGAAQRPVQGRQGGARPAQGRGQRRVRVPGGLHGRRRQVQAEADHQQRPPAGVPRSGRRRHRLRQGQRRLAVRRGRAQERQAGGHPVRPQVRRRRGPHRVQPGAQPGPPVVGGHRLPAVPRQRGAAQARAQDRRRAVDHRRAARPRRAVSHQAGGPAPPGAPPAAGVRPQRERQHRDPGRPDAAAQPHGHAGRSPGQAARPGDGRVSVAAAPAAGRGDHATGGRSAAPPAGGTPIEGPPPVVYPSTGSAISPPAAGAPNPPEPPAGANAPQ